MDTEALTGAAVGLLALGITANVASKILSKPKKSRHPCLQCKQKGLSKSHKDKIIW